MAPRKLTDLPAPPSTLADRSLPLKPLSGSLFRIYRLEADPPFWGRTGNNRFDAPADGHFGVLYCAERFDGAFIETFGDLRPRIISSASLGARGLAVVTPNRPLRLVDLAGPGLARLSLDGRISSGDHALCQQWSAALWAHPMHVDGLWYAARHDTDERSVALFDRAAAAVSVAPGRSLLDASNLALTAAAVNRYGFALLP